MLVCHREKQPGSLIHQAVDRDYLREQRILETSFYVMNSFFTLVMFELPLFCIQFVTRKKVIKPFS